MAAGYPSGTNTFIPSTEATNNLVVDFSRNPSKFALPKWIQYVPVEKNVGRYIEMTVEMAGRVLSTDGSELRWPDGTTAPSGSGNTESFEFKPYSTVRHALPFWLGELAVEQAAWDVLAQHARITAQRAMTNRSLQAITAAVTSGNYLAAHTSAVSSITGVTGAWDVSTTSRKDIKRSFDHAAETIQKATLGAVDPSDMMVVMSPGCARKLSVSQEIVDHVKGSPAAERELKEGLGPNTRYGLPARLYGYEIVIEDTVRVSTRKGATTTKSFALADATPFMTSRVGELEGVEGSPSFSTWSLFLKEEMTVESKHDRDNRRHEGRVVDDFDVINSSQLSGFLFTSAVS